MKLFSKHIYLLACAAAFFVGMQNAEAQDPRYSQYYAAPARLSPALAGVIDGNWRLGINYRTQWGSVLDRAYNSGSFTADAKFAVFQNDYIGVGFNAMYDQAAISAYSVTDIGFDINYQKLLYQGRGRIGKEYTSYLVAGAHVGIGQRSVNWGNLTYSTQFDTEAGQTNYYNTGISSGETQLQRDARLYPDFHAGLMWYGTFGNRRNAYAGASIFHLNRPDISLFNSPPQDTSGTSFSSPLEKLYMRTNIHAGGEILVGGRGSAISLLPGAVVMIQGPSTEINTGVSMKYQQPRYDDFAIRFGIWNRISNQFVDVNNATMGIDALIFILGLDWNEFQFGFSYDATLSKLSPVNNSRGAMEISVIYTFDQGHSRRQTCPAFN
jgi:type IX secretion system PorP/SprF family membrane protein